MRKYQQLLLLLISAISLLLLLIYRHEYNRLHYVLEVFNYFGQPISCNITELSTFQQDYGPEPNLCKVEETYYYSAFLMEEYNMVQAIAIEKDLKDMKHSCYLWYEDRNVPINGKFKYSKISDDNTDFAFFHYCSYNTNMGIPYAVSFSNKNKRKDNFKKIIIYTKNKLKLHSNITLCIAPSTYDKNMLLEFISYHKLIGIDDFVFYGNEIPYRITSILKNLSQKLNIKLTFFNSNLKTDNSVFNLVEQDCLLRMKGHTKTVAILDLSEFIVPTYHHTLYKMLTDFDSRENTRRFSLPIINFCMQNYDHRDSIILQNLHLQQSSNQSFVKYIYRSDISNNFNNTHAITRGIASIHKYVNCSSNNLGNRDDSTLRFSSELRQSTLVHLLLHNSI